MNTSPVTTVLASRLIGLVTTVAIVLTISTAQARPAPETSRVDIKKIVVQEALASSVPPSLALAVAKVESDFQAHVESSKGARGVMQIMPATGTGEWGVDPDELWDPRLNIRLGIDYLERLIKRYDGNWEFALSFYNGGSKVGKPGQARVLPWTRKYVNNVLRWEKRYAAQEQIWLALVDRETLVNGDIKAGQTWTQVADSRDWPGKTKPVFESDFHPVHSAGERSGHISDEVSAMHTEKEARRQSEPLRPRLIWRDAPERTFDRDRPLRKQRKLHQPDNEFDGIEQRRQAIRGSLDDFS